MKIVLSGVETKNKGAELMLYAILQEVEKKYPDAEILLPKDRMFHQKKYINTNLKFTLTPRSIWSKLHVDGIYFRLNIDYPTCFYPRIVKQADYFIDGSGLYFSDKMIHNKFELIFWKNLKKYKAQGTKVILLPQAFGPVDNALTKEAVNIISKYADLIIAREDISLNYLKEADTNMAIVRKYSDFTNLVDGIFPSKYEALRNGVCIIPNKQMIRTGIISHDAYIHIFSLMINEVCKTGYKPYLLNHEGKEDEELMLDIKSKLNVDIPLVTGLNALEVKGLIASSYMCITSRFHGVASALNSCVPCLATSWSHKYEELFKDYNQYDCVLNLKDDESIKQKISDYLNPQINNEVRSQLSMIVPEIKEQTRNMWNEIWSL